MTPVLGIIASSNQQGRGGAVGSYDALASVRLTASTSTIIFAGIPNGYRHLQIRASALNSGQEGLYIAYNGDTTGSNYRDHQMGANGSSVFAFSNAGVNGLGAGIGLVSQTTPAANIIDIIDYSSNVKNTTTRSFWGVDRNGAGSVGIFSNLWNNTSAVTSITLGVSTYPFQANTFIALYGVK